MVAYFLHGPVRFEGSYPCFHDRQRHQPSTAVQVPRALQSSPNAQSSLEVAAQLATTPAPLSSRRTEQWPFRVQASEPRQSSRVATKHDVPSEVQRPNRLQMVDDLQSSVVAGTQGIAESEFRLHRPVSLHCSDARQSSSVEARQRPSSNEHRPVALHTSACAQSADDRGRHARSFKS